MTKTASAFLNSVGVNVHLYLRAPCPYSNMPLIESLLSQLGITHLRDGAFFSTVVNKDTYYYQNIRALAALGYKFSLVCFGPEFPNWFTPPDQAANISAWCSGAVEQFEGDNETSLKAMATKNPPMSAWMQGQLYHTVRGALTVPVLGPSYIWNGCIQPNGVDLRIPVPSLCSQVNFHPYPGMEWPETTTPAPGGGMLSQLAWAQIAQGQTPAQPAQATENGYHTALQDPSTFLGVSEAIKARYLPRMMLFAFISGITRTYIYQLIDDAPNDPTKNATMFGLADYNGNPKPAFGAVSNLMALCAPRSAGAIPNWGFSLSGDQTNVQSLLVSRADGSAVLFAWLGVSGWDNVNKVALAPVTRPCVLTVTGHSPTAAVGHLFNDDGMVATASLSPVPGGGFGLTLSDQLTAVELTP